MDYKKTVIMKIFKLFMKKSAKTFSDKRSENSNLMQVFGTGSSAAWCICNMHPSDQQLVRNTGLQFASSVWFNISYSL